MCSEVNQLLTAVWSPVASVEQNRCPVAGHGSDDVARFAVVTDTGDCGKLCSVFEDVHGTQNSSASGVLEKRLQN